MESLGVKDGLSQEEWKMITMEASTKVALENPKRSRKLQDWKQGVEGKMELALEILVKFIE